MSLYDITVDKTQLTYVYDENFSNFTDPSLVTTKSYVDYKNTLAVANTNTYLQQKASEIIGVTGSTQYYFYESQLNTIKKVSAKIQEDLTDATDILNYLNNEISRGNIADSGLSSSIYDVERTRAINSESQLSSDITSEQNRATTVEGNISISKNNLTSFSTGNENGLSFFISYLEYNRALTAENLINTQINTEQNTFGSSNTAEYTSMSSGDTLVSNARVNEQTLRVAGDTSFQQGLSNENYLLTSGLTSEYTTMSNNDSSINNTSVTFVNKTNTQLSGTTFSNNTYIFSSDIDVSNHKLYFGPKWRLSASATESIFEYNTTGTTWKRVVRFGV